MALTSPTGGGRSVGIVRSRTKATEFSLVFNISPIMIINRIYEHQNLLYINYQLDALITLVNKILAHESFIVFLT